jgi:20S proteasome subunit beta 1
MAVYFYSKPSTILARRSLFPGCIFVFLVLCTILQSVYAHPAIPVDLGTTLVALKYKGGVILAADSRTSMASYVSHRCADKIVPLSSHCLVARSGSAADTQMLAHAAKQEIQDRYFRHGMRASVSQVARFMETIVGGNGNGSSELSVSLLIAGYDVHLAAGKIYSLSASGALLEDTVYAVAGSGSPFIMGYLDTHANEFMSEADAIKLCKHAVQLAISRDASSGGLIRLFICNGAGIRQHTVHPKSAESINKLEK